MTASAQSAVTANLARRFRFGRYRVRTLLLVATVAACVLGWWCSGPREQRLAVESLRQGNAIVEYDVDEDRFSSDWRFRMFGHDAFADVVVVYLPPFCRRIQPDLGALDALTAVREVYSEHPMFGNAVLKHVGRMKDLRQLHLGGSSESPECAPITDDGLAPLRRLPALEVLELGGADITGSGLAYLENLSALKELDLANTRLSDEGLKHLGALKQLQCLYLSGTQITGSGLTSLSGLAALNSLDLRNTQVDDRGLRNLRNLPALESLDLQGTRICNLEPLKDLHTLSTLDLRGTKIGDQLQALRHLTALRSLGLAYTNTGDIGLEHLAGMKNLTSLNLQRTRVTDLGLRHLRELTKLTYLNLEGVPITDEGLKHLKALYALQRLDLTDTRVTKQGIAKLRLAPNCLMSFHGTSFSFKDLNVWF